MRIIDVNVNRAMEGLRVVEEVCRFILEDKKLTARVKNLRAYLLKVTKTIEGPLKQKRLKARKAMADVGRAIFTRAEGQRFGLEGVFQANIKRAQEAVRCLEEFSKLIEPKYGKDYKALRFKLYELDKAVSRRFFRQPE